MQENRPRIGVTWVTPGEEVSDNYLKAVRNAGGEPVALLADAASWRAELAGIHGLLLTGGGDVSPERYGEMNRGKCAMVSAQRDELEFEALRFCTERGLPVLGICRGFQVINVGLGGRLVQDIDTEHVTEIAHPSDASTSPRQSRYHEIELLPGTLLASIAGTSGEVDVNSRHHQGVTSDMVASGLKVSAMAADGIVEGLEREGEPLLLAVQCHPERPGEALPLVPVFGALVERARAALPRS